VINIPWKIRLINKGVTDFVLILAIAIAIGPEMIARVKRIVTSAARPSI
jgi:hypothetical protein